MLIELRIEDFAIIDRLNLLFAPGLVIFTGETGAGKSIIIDAVETLLGGRADTVQIRSGANQASVEAVFQVPDSSRQTIRSILEREDLLEDSNELTISREIRLNGRSVARLNGRSVSAGLVREISELLIDIHGQSEHLSLLKVSQHLNLLDRYAAAENKDNLLRAQEAYTQAYRKIQQVLSGLEEIRRSARDTARLVDMLSFQINEIDNARFSPDEEEALREERTRLANAESLASLSQQALLVLDDGSAESSAATDLIGQAVEALTALSRLDPSQSKIGELAQTIFDELVDLTRDTRQYLDNIEFNPKRLDQVEERLALLQSLKRKYGDSITAIQTYAENARIQLNQITHEDQRIDDLEKERNSLLETLGKEGLEVSKLRKAAAKRLEEGIVSELAELHMPGASFRVDFEQQPDENGARLPDGTRFAYYPSGLDKIEFMIAPNPGEGFKPLIKIASGGETSRLMLALKNVLVQADQVSTLIFDEIDQGIGGRVGGIVGEKLRQLGKQHQVICITHLPQLAAYGEQHFRVEKQITAGRTTTTVTPLLEEERLLELAQMMGGVSAGTLQSARELIQTVQN